MRVVGRFIHIVNGPERFLVAGLLGMTPVFCFDAEPGSFIATARLDPSNAGLRLRSARAFWRAARL
jgi:hypothetical protein